MPPAADHDLHRAICDPGSSAGLHRRGHGHPRCDRDGPCGRISTGLPITFLPRCNLSSRLSAGAQVQRGLGHPQHQKAPGKAAQAASWATQNRCSPAPSPSGRIRPFGRSPCLKLPITMASASTVIPFGAGDVQAEDPELLGGHHHRPGEHGRGERGDWGGVCGLSSRKIWSAST